MNCAGLHGDQLEALLLGNANFSIRPRKGQFVVFDKQAAKTLTTTILPVPTDRTKGAVLARTIYGNLLVGPTAEDQDDRIRATVERPVLQALVAKAIELVPISAEVPITAAYAGLRPASDKKEYRIQNEEERRWITLGGIRSTGLTAALGLASHAAENSRSAQSEKSDITLKALCDRLLAERGVKADTSIMSRFFRRIGVTLKKDAHRARAGSCGHNAPQSAQAKPPEARRCFAAGVHRRNLDRDQHDAALRLGPRGERLVAKVPHGHWKTATFLAALRNDRIEAPCATANDFSPTSNSSSSRRLSQTTSSWSTI